MNTRRGYTNRPKYVPEGYHFEYQERGGAWIKFGNHKVWLEGFALTFFQALCLQYKDEELAKKEYEQKYMNAFRRYMKVLQEEESGVSTTVNAAPIEMSVNQI